MFNISRRIKAIDRNYYIVFNNKTNKWEVHCKTQPGGYCLTCPYRSLDSRLLSYVLRTSLVHNPNLIEDVEKNNEMLDKDSNNARLDYIESNLKDVYSTIDNSSKNYDWNKMLTTKWL